MFTRQSAPPPLLPGAGKPSGPSALRSAWPSGLLGPQTTDEVKADPANRAADATSATDHGMAAPGATETSQPTVTTAARPDSGSRPRSVISNDLTISGHQLRIVTKSTLQVDGAIEGDVEGAEVVIGELGRVVGTITAEKITVEGQVEGTIRAVQVDLKATARVEGEIHHQQLSIDASARFEGTVRRAADTQALLRA